MGIGTRLLNFLGLERRSSDLGAGYVSAAPVLSGTYVTPASALSLTAVFSAINVISRDCATLPLHVYKRLPNGGLEIARDYYLEELLTISMDDEIDAFRQRRDCMGHVLGWGNGYGQIARDGKGYVKAIHLRHPAKTVPKVAESGRLYYSLDNDDTKRVALEDMLHLAGLGFNGLTGYSPITVCRQSVGLTLGAEQFGAAFYGNSAKAGGILTIPEKLPPQAKANIRNSINQVHQGTQNAHNLMILEEGVEYIGTQISQDDAQFIATRQFQVIEIARLFSVPPHKIGDYSESHLANVEEANLDYLTTTIAGWVRMLEAQYNWKLLSRDERKKYVILHDFSALLRGNTAARASYYQVMRNMGCLSADDILRAEGLNPIGPAKGGDKYLVQMQYQPLEKAGVVPTATTTTTTTTTGAEPGASPAEDVAKTAFTGVQITSLLEIVNNVVTGQIPMETGKQILAMSFPTMSEADIDALFAPVVGFTPAEPGDDPASPEPPPPPEKKSNGFVHVNGGTGHV